VKALLWKTYGGSEDLGYGEVPVPVPRSGELLVRVRAVSLNAADLHLMRADPFPVRLYAGLTKPKWLALGADVAGTVEAVGAGVTKFRAGDEVLGDLSGGSWGAMAEYVCAEEGSLVFKPAALSFVEAAAIPMAGVTALQALQTKGGLRTGQKVLVQGASGGVGTFSVQLAKALGAEVTAVCSTAHVDLIRSLGADRVIDYTREDFVEGGPRFDLIHAANGDRSIFDYQKALVPGGRYVSTGGSMKQLSQALLLGPWLSLARGRTLGGMTASPNPSDLAVVVDLVAQGKVRPVIDRIFPLDQGAEALRYLEEGHARGKVVVTVTQVPS